MHGLLLFVNSAIGKKGFAGNFSLLPGGKSIGADGLLGSLSLPPENHDSAIVGSAWLGSPAVFLPKRELFTGFSQQQTYEPPKKLYALRLAIEFLEYYFQQCFLL